MKRGWKKRAIAVYTAAVLTVGVFPVVVPAVTGSEKAKDGSYEGWDYALAKTIEGGTADTYKMAVKLTVKDGIFSRVDVSTEEHKEASDDHIRRTTRYLQEFLLNKEATEDSIQAMNTDAVSGATASCTALKQASLHAIREERSPSPPSPTVKPDPTEAPTPSEAPKPSEAPEPTLVPDPEAPGEDDMDKDSFKEGAPTMSAVLSADQCSVVVSWSDYKGAESYEVLRRSGGAFSVLASGQKGLSYTDNSAEPGKNYYYSVRAVSTKWGGTTRSQDAKSVYVSVPALSDKPAVEAKKPGQAAISKVTAVNYNSLTVTWAEAENATGYIVSRSTSKSKGYKTVKTVAGGSTTSYADTGLKTGTTYYYKVQAINDAGSETLKGAASAAKSGKCTLGKTTVTVTPGKKKAVVKWEKVDGANGYVVCRSTSKSKGYKAVKTIKKGTTVSFTNTKLTSKKTYYYKVRAYRTVSGKKVYSAYSGVVGKKIK